MEFNSSIAFLMTTSAVTNLVSLLVQIFNGALHQKFLSTPVTMTLTKPWWPDGRQRHVPRWIGKKTTRPKNTVNRIEDDEKPLTT